MRQLTCKGLAVILAICILNLHAVRGFSAENDGSASGTNPSRALDFRAAVKVAVAGILEIQSRMIHSSAAPAGSEMPAFADTQNQSSSVRTAPPVDAPRTSRSHRIAAFVALAAVGAATAALAIHAARKGDPKLTPGTPTRVSP
jgi:hypothetical protein